MTDVSLLNQVNLVFGVLGMLALLAAIVLTAVLARGRARWLGPLGFGLFLLQHLVYVVLPRVLGPNGVPVFASGLVLEVAGATCLALAVILGFRDARISRPAGPGPSSPVPRQP